MAGSIALDIIARDQASGTFNRVGKSADRSAGRMRAFGVAAKYAALGLAAGAVAAGAAAVKLAKGAMEDEAAAKKMAVAFRNNAGATRAQIAATEDWISAQGVAKGVADDDLRPALTKLIGATHDVGKAQRLASLAMDISAGTGKDLSVVSQALTKAQNGSTAGLAKFGVAMKDSKGKAVDFDTAVSRLGKTFKGQAAAAADTTAGRFARLKLVLSETGESIGYKLLPYATQFAGWVLNKGIPAVSAIASYLKVKLGPAFSAIGDFIQNRVMPAFRRVGSESPGIFSKIIAAAQPVVGWFRTNWPLIAGTVRDAGALIKRELEIYRAFWRRWGGDIMSVTRRAFSFVGKIIVGTLTVIRGIFRTVTALLKGDWRGAWQGMVMILKGAVSNWRATVSLAWDGIKAVMRAGGRATIAYLKALPGRWRAALGYLSGVLVNAGKALVQGLVNGIKRAAGAAVGAIKGVAGRIKSAFKGDLGIFSPSRVFLGYGKNILEGLVNGLEKGRTPLARVLDAVTNQVKRTGDRLKRILAKRREFVSGFTGIGGTAFGAQPVEGATTLTLGDVMKFNQERAAAARAYRANLSSVIKKGLSAQLIKDLQSQGESGAQQLAALAGASRGQIAEINSLNKQTDAQYRASGNLAADRIFGSQVAKAATDAQNARTLERLVRALERQVGKDEYLVVKLNGQTLVSAIRKEERTKGKRN